MTALILSLVPFVIVVLIMSWTGGPVLGTALPSWGVCLGLIYTAFSWRAGRLRLGRRHPITGMIWEPVDRNVPIRTVWVVVLTLSVFAFVATISMLLPPAIAAGRLHDPNRTVAEKVWIDGTCSRCDLVVHVWFAGPNGRIATDLWEPTQADSFYRAGIPVVYQTDNPTRAMALRDYTDGRGPVPLASSALAFLLLAAASTAVLRARPVSR